MLCIRLMDHISGPIWKFMAQRRLRCKCESRRSADQYYCLHIAAAVVSIKQYLTKICFHWHSFSPDRPLVPCTEHNDTLTFGLSAGKCLLNPHCQSNEEVNNCQVYHSSCLSWISLSRILICDQMDEPRSAKKELWFLGLFYHCFRRGFSCLQRKIEE